ncbi:MAG: hypothetical protein GX621_09990 [Pirellulaceae bacterium]|nr:hypothetical protein [Pirellulaceae bacterium]
MQCPSCHFENMPGVEACGRCGAVLRVASMAIDVNPPRAKRKGGHWRAWYPFLRRWQSAKHGIAPILTLARQGLDEFSRTRPTWGLLARMFVPGWPQFFAGDAVRGRIMLWGYLAAMPLGLLFIGTFFGSMLIGSALALHASSVVDFIFAGTARWPIRIAYLILCFVVLAGAIYVPAHWAFSQVVVPQRIARTAPPLYAGDVILYNPSAYVRAEPRLGDVVVYEVPAGRTPAAVGNVVYAIGGLRIDRVLAGPGQTIEIKEDGIWVDGRQSPWRPLNEELLPLSLKLTVPDGCHFIFLSTDPIIPAFRLMEFAVVPSNQIRGRVFMRSQPLWRLTSFR